MLPLLEAARDHATWTVVSSAKALQHMRQGDLGAAQDEARRARALAARSSIATTDTSIILRNLLDMWRWSPCLGEALEVADEFRQRLARLAPLGDFPQALEPLAALYLQLGRADLAQPLVDDLLRRPPVRAREQMRLRLLQHQLARTVGQAEPVAWPLEALAAEDLPLLAEWALWSGLAAESHWPLPDLQALAGRCEQTGLALLARALSSLAAWRQVQQAPGAAVPGMVPAAATGLHGLHGATPWVALWVGLALQAQGDVPAARLFSQAGMAWLRDTVVPGLPEAFQASYLGRNPLHRALAKLAARLGA